MTATATPTAIAPPRDVVTFSLSEFTIVRSSFGFSIAVLAGSPERARTVSLVGTSLRDP